jgi:dihydroneopterin aldolase
MIGTAGLKGLRIECVIGVYPEERARTQTILVDVELDYDFAAAAASDDIQSAVDYAAVSRSVRALAEHGQFQLIETLAEQAAAMLLAQPGLVQAVRVEVRKPGAIPDADGSFDRLERKRP